MYVVRWQNLDTNNVIEHTAGGAVRYFPADRCTFEIAPVINNGISSGYEISQIRWYGGHQDGVALPVGTNVGRAQYGVIGKSGRFVGLSLENT